MINRPSTNKVKKILIILCHVAFWVLYILFMHMITIIQETGNVHTKIHVTITRYTLSAVVFYASAYIVFPYCFRNKNYIYRLLLVLPLSILLNFALRRFVIGSVVPYLLKVPKPEARIFEYFILSLKWWFDYTLFGLGFWYALKLIKTQHLLRITQKARLEAEFNHLRTQINPHFLFNTLNTFYSQSLLTLPDTAKGISLLSKIMRYSLEPPGTDGKVPLEDELAHANDYIELMKIRFPGMLSITSNLPAESPEGWQILPHIIITLVENAFKHGNREQPFLFDLELANNQITFRVENTIGEKPADSGAGVGLPNLKERLFYAYGKKCTFEEGQQGNKYKTLLVIPDAYIIPEITAKEEPRPGFNYQLSNLS